MNKQRKLKKELKSEYRFEQKFTAAMVQHILETLEPGDFVVEVAKLTVGVVRLDIVIYWNDGNCQLGYDLMVKDSPSSKTWICYDSLTEEVRIHSRNLEREMFQVLDRAVERNGLSYTECNFRMMEGKPAVKQ